MQGMGSIKKMHHLSFFFLLKDSSCSPIWAGFEPHILRNSPFIQRFLDDQFLSFGSAPEVTSRGVRWDNVLKPVLTCVDHSGQSDGHGNQ